MSPFHRVLALMAFAIASMACEPSAAVGSASCSACGRTFTMADCERFAAAAGCASFGLEDSTVGSCTNQCTFSSCDSVPECDAVHTPRDAAVDAFVDPRCEGEDGLFPTCDLCPDSCGDVTIDGATMHTCDCGACPCGFQCGSIALPSGGTLSSVCAPAP